MFCLMLVFRCRGVYLLANDPKKLKDFINKTINQTNFKFMENQRYYIILGYMDLEKLIVYVIKDNGDNISIVSLNKDGSFLTRLEL